MKNRKGIILTASILGTIAIASTGFAAWVISTQDTKTAEGTVTVDTISEREHTITVTEGDNEFFFGGHPSGWDAEAHKSDWLIFDSSDTKGKLTEDLEASWTIKVANKDTADVTPTLAVDSAENWTITSSGLEGKEGIKGEFKRISDSGAVYLTYELSFSEWTDDEPSTTKKSTMTLKFSWGEKFGKSNPYVYYSGKDISGENGSAAAKTALDNLIDLNGKTLTISLTTSDKTAA